MRNKDLIRVRHMLDAAEEALLFVTEKTRSDVEKDRLLALALMKSIEIIGEASSKISLEFRRKYPELPWGDIIGMRNILVHAYDDVDPDVLWKSVVEDLPDLIISLRMIFETENRKDL